jgi:hypothetical protein
MLAKTTGIQTREGQVLGHFLCLLLIVLLCLVWVGQEVGLNMSTRLNGKEGALGYCVN